MSPQVRPITWYSGTGDAIMESPALHYSASTCKMFLKYQVYYGSITVSIQLIQLSRPITVWTIFGIDNFSELEQSCPLVTLPDYDTLFLGFHTGLTFRARRNNLKNYDPYMSFQSFKLQIQLITKNELQQSFSSKCHAKHQTGAQRSVIIDNRSTHLQLNLKKFLPPTFNF